MKNDNISEIKTKNKETVGSASGQARYLHSDARRISGYYEVPVEVLDNNCPVPLMEDFDNEEDEQVSEEDQLLLAWLDEELSIEERTAIEKKIQESPELRQKMEELKDTWKMLGTLETDPASPLLLKSTMEIVALSAQEEIKKKEKILRRKRLVLTLSFIGIFGVAIFLGHWLVSKVVPDPLTQMKKNVPFILWLDQLDSTENFSFLLQLKDSGMFDDEVFQNLVTMESDNAEDQDYSNNNTSMITTAYPLGIPIEDITADKIDFTKLLADNNFHRLELKYNRLSNERRKALRSLYDQIEHSADRSILYRTMDNYYTWMRSSIHETLRDKIMATKIENRIPEIRSCMEIYKINLVKNKEMKSNKGWLNKNKGSWPGNQMPGKQIPDSQKSDNPKFLKQENKKEMNWSNNPSFPPEENNERNRYFQNNDNRFRFVMQRLPEELQKEDLSWFSRSFMEFYAEKEKEFKNKYPDNKIKCPSFFRIITDYISSQPVENFIKKLSPEAQKYFNGLPGQEEKKRMIGLLFSVELGKKGAMDNCKQDECQMNPCFPNPDNIPFPPNDKFGARPSFNRNEKVNYSLNRQMMPQRSQWMNESTKELADTLRKLPQDKQDELLSLPNEEMYARLLMLHWGFDPKRNDKNVPPRF